MDYNYYYNGSTCFNRIPALISANKEPFSAYDFITYLLELGPIDAEWLEV